MELSISGSVIKKVEDLATQKRMENRFESLNRWMKPFQNNLVDNHLPLGESEKHRKIPAEFPGVQVKANTPLTTETSNAYEQLEAAAAAALRNGNLPDP